MKSYNEKFFHILCFPSVFPHKMWYKKVFSGKIKQMFAFFKKLCYTTFNNMYHMENRRKSS